MNNNICPSKNLTLRTLLNADYTSTHEAMLHTTLSRIENKKQGIVTANELWIVEHNDVYTLGQAGKEEHILQRGKTPIIHTDRGGQVTWHGKGQLVVYWLIDLETAGWTLRDLVSHAEQSIEDVLNRTLSGNREQQFYAKSRRDAPGVYIYNVNHLMLGKIASLGFKIKHGFSYHGIALNLTCDISSFNAINPCGYAGMQMLKLQDFVDLQTVSIKDDLISDTSSNNYISDNKTDINQPSDMNQPLVNLPVSKLKVTEQLLSNIQKRLYGDIKLRDIEDKEL
ncbi:lipoyl(octanoyl) transferase LipB [Psychrobacter sp.]|uniref:lipoyl(octanoyl) transferase LipB n=1 Tax=Psychrobacter sp. TaxID=56811 RepID=UPI0025E93088|nr:lipoyl(octanoyl) transferase LipB [Psychrobacter sp.]